MGEYFAAVNTDKGQYLDSNSLGMETKLDWMLASPVPAILTWLLADGAPISGGSAMRGSWAGDRIVVAGDEGPSASLWLRAHREFQDVTIAAFEALASDCADINLEYQERGVLDDDGRFVPDWAASLTCADRPPGPTSPPKRSPVQSDPAVIERFPSVAREDTEEFRDFSANTTELGSSVAVSRPEGAATSQPGAMPQEDGGHPLPGES